MSSPDTFQVQVGDELDVGFGDGGISSYVAIHIATPIPVGEEMRGGLILTHGTNKQKPEVLNIRLNPKQIHAGFSPALPDYATVDFVAQEWTSGESLFAAPAFPM
jgi:hypothetical protein